MDISKFTLIDGGLGGVKIVGIEKMPHEKLLFLDDVTRERKVPLSEELRNKIQGLKYFFLNLTGHWMDPFRKYIDLNTYLPLDVPTDGQPVPAGHLMLKGLWNKVDITGVTLKNGGFVITGKIDIVSGKRMGLATPFITEEDDLSFYLDAIKRINDIMDDLSSAITMKSLPINTSDKQMMLSFGASEDGMQDIDMDKLQEQVIDGLMKKGAIILMDNDDIAPQRKVLDQGTKLNTNTSSIDSHNMPEAEEYTDQDDEDPKQDEQETKDKFVGSIVSEKKFNVDMSEEQAKIKQPVSDENIPEGGTLEDYEYSSNLGQSDGNTLSDFEAGDEEVSDNIDEGGNSQW